MASEVAIKLRYGVTWETITRQQRLGSATDDPRLLAAGAPGLSDEESQPLARHASQHVGGV